MVSIPLRGKGKGKVLQSGEPVELSFNVSIPLRGKGKGKVVIFKVMRRKKELFPSPYGERVKERLVKALRLATLANSFHPLTGKG